jgi:pyridinium-3,5-bisthiocarboxylic acid mononucleotide nickel chelatase
MRTLYLDSFAGIAGDMFTAAFVDAGLVDPDTVRAVPSLLGVPDVLVEISAVQRAGARFSQIRVVLPGDRGRDDHQPVGDGHRHPQHHDHHDPPPGEAHGHQHHPHHPYLTLVRQIEGSGLDPFAKEFALRVFRLLADAEADSHGVPVEKVAFHEVGAVDSLVDVAMAGVCLGAVAADRVLASPVKLGRGSIRIEHGTYPVPPPATARLAVGMPVAPVPEAISRPNVELSTPTGLAILKTLEPVFADGWPPGTLLAQGAGAGTTDLGSYPNVFRVALFEESSTTKWPDLPYETDRVVEIRCNVDDQTGERTAWLVERALELGALDAWVTPLVGKKGRPAACIVLLVSPDGTPTFADFLLRHSSSFGVRYATWDRFKLARETEVRETPRGPVSFSVGRTRGGEQVKEKPEFEDLKKIWREDPDFRP